MNVFLYSRPGCHLCDKARAVLEGAGIAFEEVDITADPALEAEYGVLIPVVERGGRQLFEAGMGPNQPPAPVGGWRKRGRTGGASPPPFPPPPPHGRPPPR